MPPDSGLLHKSSRSEARVLCRRDRLVRGLTGVGIHRDDNIMVLCCANHDEDRQVAVTAVQVLGAKAVVPATWGDPHSLRELTERASTRVFLACEEGVDAWRASGARGRMIGDSPGVLWWKGLEARHAS
jgi:hypothetical protein